MTKQSIDTRTLWNVGAKYGLILGLASGAFIFLNMLTAAIAGGGTGAKMLAMLLNVALWLVKFVGCLWLMRFFMLKLVADYDGVTGKHTFRLGVIIALASSLICSGVSLLNVCIISPDEVKASVDVLMQSYSQMLSLGDGDRMALEQAMGWYPQISFFSNFIYCFIYGVIVSLIFSRSIPAKDIFSDGPGSQTGSTAE